MINEVFDGSELDDRFRENSNLVPLSAAAVPSVSGFSVLGVGILI
jgi:hypothetical protein